MSLCDPLPSYTYSLSAVLAFEVCPMKFKDCMFVSCPHIADDEIIDQLLGKKYKLYDLSCHSVAWKKPILGTNAV